MKVILHKERLESDNVMEIFAPYDLIIDGTDNFATRYLVNDACVLLHKPYVWGSIYRFDGQASVFWADYGPCYRCLYPEPPPPGMVPSCAEGGVLGVLCASIGSIQVNEAIKLITGIGDSLAGRLMIYDALEMSYRTVKVNKDPDCAICGKNPTVTELIDYEAFCGAVSEEAEAAVVGSTISAKDLAGMLDRGDNIFLVDVREPNEYEIVSIPGATLIPKGEFLNGSALEKMPQDKQIVLHCKSGARSAEVLAVLKSAGFSDAVHVGGGVLAWVNQVDPPSRRTKSQAPGALGRPSSRGILSARRANPRLPASARTGGDVPLLAPRSPPRPANRYPPAQPATPPGAASLGLARCLAKYVRRRPPGSRALPTPAGAPAVPFGGCVGPCSLAALRTGHRSHWRAAQRPWSHCGQPSAFSQPASAGRCRPRHSRICFSPAASAVSPGITTRASSPRLLSGPIG